MRLSKRVNQEILPKMASELGKNILSLPQLKKVVITVGLGPFRERKEVLEAIEKELTQITGQKPKFNVAKKSIAGFKLREGQTVGYQVTIRGIRMWDFLERLTSVVIPRLREFDGVSEKSLDTNSNLTISLREQVIFPEIKHDEIKENWGLGITLSLKKSQDKEVAKRFYKELGIIFK